MLALPACPMDQRPDNRSTVNITDSVIGDCVVFVIFRDRMFEIRGDRGGTVTNGLITVVFSPDCGDRRVTTATGEPVEVLP